MKMKLTRSSIDRNVHYAISAQNGAIIAQGITEQSALFNAVRVIVSEALRLGMTENQLEDAIDTGFEDAGAPEQGKARAA